MTASAAQRSLHDRLVAELGVAGEVRANEPLGPQITVRAGGHAELLVRPKTGEALVNVLRAVRDEGCPLSILGGGANTLVGDLGVPGVTVKLPVDLAREEIVLDEEGGRITLGGGAAIAKLVTRMKANGLVGAEFLAGIPGTLGGAVTMNAGTKMGECMTVVEAVELATADGLGWKTRAELPFRYRHTELPPLAVVTRVRFRLLRGDVKASQEKMDADLGYRKRTQPLNQPNFGSVFKNPEGDHAGRLIETVQLKGHTIGRAQISTQHANWIVNLGGATTRDITSLMALAQQRVHEATRRVAPARGEADREVRMSASPRPRSTARRGRAWPERSRAAANGRRRRPNRRDQRRGEAGRSLQLHGCGQKLAGGSTCLQHGQVRAKTWLLDDLRTAGTPMRPSSETRPREPRRGSWPWWGRCASAPRSPRACSSGSRRPGPGRTSRRRSR